MNGDVAPVVIRAALVVGALSLSWIVGSLLVDVVRLVRGALTTRTFMGVVARYLVVGAAVTPVVHGGGVARAATCDVDTDESDRGDSSPLWSPPTPPV